MKAWLCKWWGLLLLAAGFMALLSTWNPKRASSRAFHLDAPLPEGRVKPQLISTWDTAVLLAPDGSLWTWGGHQFGLTGVLPARKPTTTPVQVGTESDWARVGASYSATIAVKTNGTLWGWGYSHEGELLTMSRTTPLPPKQLGTNTNWADVHVGHGHVLARKRDGSLWAWGRNTYGGVGDGSGTNAVLVPAHICPHAKWKTAAAPAFNSFGIQTDGTLWGWGLDLFSGSGKTNLPLPTLLDPSTNWVSLSAGDFALLALKADGTLWICGQNAHGFASGTGARSGPTLVQIGTDTDWREVTAGQGYFMACKANGSWWGCGNNSLGQLGLGSTSPHAEPIPRLSPLRFDPWALSAGTGNTTALLGRDGTLWTWGVRAGAPPRISLFDQLRQLSARVTASGRGYSHGSNPVFAHDVQPHFIWELPPSMKTALGTNGSSASKPPQ